MQIIFGDHVEKIRDRFTVLELDKVKVNGTDTVIQLWCALETLPLEDMPMIDHLKKLHQDLMQQYRKQNWDFCCQAIEQLQGRWNGELDSFYENLMSRIKEFTLVAPPTDWTGDLVKDIS